jgi:hypothetical protein
MCMTSIESALPIALAATVLLCRDADLGVCLAEVAR